MPTTDPIKIPIEGQDKLTPVTQKAGSALKELGANVSMVGMRISGMFTLPIAAGFASLNSYGAEASKTVADLKNNVNEAIKTNDPAKINATLEAWNKLSPSVRLAADAYGKMKAALTPVNDAFSTAKANLLQGLVPVVQQLTPMLVTLANGARDLAVWFNGLSDGTKTSIVTVLGLVAAIGPVIVIVGQLMTAVGSAQAIIASASVAIGGFTTASIVAALPVVALVAAIGLLAFVVVKFGEDAWTTAKQLMVLGNNLIGGKQAAINTLKFFDEMDAGIKKTNTDLTASIPILQGVTTGWNNLTNAMTVNAGGQHHNAPLGTGTGRGNLYTGTWASSAAPSMPNLNANNFAFNISGGNAQDIAKAVEAKIREMQRTGQIPR